MVFMVLKLVNKSSVQRNVSLHGRSEAFLSKLKIPLTRKLLQYLY